MIVGDDDLDYLLHCPYLDRKTLSKTTLVMPCLFLPFYLANETRAVMPEPLSDYS